MPEESATSHFFSRIARWFRPAIEALDLGDPIPEILLPDDGGAIVNLAAQGTNGWMLVYFYPRADTPSCTKQACSLRDSYTDLLDEGVQVFGVSMDKVEALQNFRKKYQLPFTLLSDQEGKLAAAFGVPHSFGFARRQAFLFKDGHLRWSDLAASTSEQADDALAVVRQLHSDESYSSLIRPS